MYLHTYLLTYLYFIVVERCCPVLYTDLSIWLWLWLWIATFDHSSTFCLLSMRGLQPLKPLQSLVTWLLQKLVW